MLYFAYGANMNHENMRTRCPEHKFLGRAALADYKFVYDGSSRLRGGGVSNIVSAWREKVWGGVYEVSEAGMKQLDRYEGSPKYYQRVPVSVKQDDGTILDAIAYRRSPLTENPPASSYRQEVLEGATDCGLPEEYITKTLES